jgi:hypothetical protein
MRANATDAGHSFWPSALSYDANAFRCALDGIHSDPKNFSHSGVGSRDILLWFRDGHGSPTAKVNFAHRYAVHRQRRRTANDEQQLQAPSHFTKILH